MNVIMIPSESTRRIARAAYSMSCAAWWDVYCAWSAGHCDTPMIVAYGSAQQCDSVVWC